MLEHDSRFMLEQARFNIKYASIALQGSDDGDMRVAGFHVEQAIELLLKQAIYECGEDFRRDHSFHNMLAKLPESQVIFSESVLLRVENSAAMLRNWSTELRYVRNYCATRRQIKVMLDLAKEMVAEFDAYVLSTIVSEKRPGVNTMKLE